MRNQRNSEQLFLFLLTSSGAVISVTKLTKWCSFDCSEAYWTEQFYLFWSIICETLLTLVDRAHLKELFQRNQAYWKYSDQKSMFYCENVSDWIWSFGSKMWRTLSCRNRNCLIPTNDFYLRRLYLQFPASVFQISHILCLRNLYLRTFCSFSLHRRMLPSLIEIVPGRYFIGTT